MTQEMFLNKKIKNCIALLLGVSVAVTPLAMGLLPKSDSLAAKAKKKAIMVSIEGKLIKPVKKGGYAIGKKYLMNGKKAAKAMKAKYKYVKKSKAITVKKGKLSLKFKLGSKKYTLSGKKRKTNIAPIKYGNILYLPAKAMAKGLGYTQIQYLKSEKILFINKRDKDYATASPSASEGLTTPGYTDVPLSDATPGSSAGLNAGSNATATSSATNESGSAATPTSESTAAPTPTPVAPGPTILEYKVYGNDFEKNTTFFNERYGVQDDQLEESVQPGANGTQNGMKFGGNWTTFIFNSGISLMVGEEYVVSFYAKGGFYKAFITGDRSKADIHNSQGIGPEDWKLYEVKFVAGTDVDGAFTMNIQTGTEPCYIDEFKLTRLHDTANDPEVENPLPRMEIVAPDAYKILGLADKSVKVDAEISINDGTKARRELFAPTMANLSGRGNSTFASEFLSQYPKRPLKFTFKNKASKSILGMPAGRKWNLMADMYDRTLMRNYLAQNFAKSLPGLEWQPSCEHVELYVNGEYYGVYLLTEAVTEERTRLNINTDTEDTDEPGFIVEWDDRAEWEGPDSYNDLSEKEKANLSPDDMYFIISMRNRSGGWEEQPFAFKEPEPQDMTATQRAYVKKSIQDMSTAIGNVNKWEDYLDVDAFVDFYMVNDIFANYDATSFSSVYMYKRPGEKVKMGPCWDYDIYIGNNNDNTETEWIEWGASPWVYRLIKNSSSFRKVFRDHWYDTNRDLYQTELIDELEVVYKKIKDAATRNFERWPVLDKSMFGSDSRDSSLPHTYESEVEYLRQWLKNRKTFLDTFYRQRYGN